jgi:hypothetical protein
MAQLVKPQPDIWKVPCFDLGRNTDYSQILSWFSSALQIYIGIMSRLRLGSTIFLRFPNSFSLIILLACFTGIRIINVYILVNVSN